MLVNLISFILGGFAATILMFMVADKQDANKREVKDLDSDTYTSDSGDFHIETFDLDKLNEDLKE